jgi:hypothetical protein
MRVQILAAAFLALTASISAAGTGYKVTAMQGDKEVTYEVKFGGGRAFERWTAFDPASKKFVYLDWKRGQAEPKPVATIWDHRTGETVKLYKFPGVEGPLTVIPSVEDMKVCPMTGDKKLKAVPVLAYD